MIRSREIIKMLKADGWYQVNSEGDHFQFRHPLKPGKVTFKHPIKDISVDLLKKMERQSGLKFNKRPDSGSIRLHD
ncbi:MAG: type II toxin-antitoxin system HicA family toxin [Desulfarculales bacterium]|jgi:predicted RNA binding protein YcfA (HicA-like mRNA interferase family)|nr:type II toxin-antitoxin system HicA family toxin [Desulfarculales bacterium]